MELCTLDCNSFYPLVEEAHLSRFLPLSQTPHELSKPTERKYETYESSFQNLFPVCRSSQLDWFDFALALIIGRSLVELEQRSKGLCYHSPKPTFNTTYGKEEASPVVNRIRRGLATLNNHWRRIARARFDGCLFNGRREVKANSPSGMGLLNLTNDCTTWKVYWLTALPTTFHTNRMGSLENLEWLKNAYRLRFGIF